MLRQPWGNRETRPPWRGGGIFPPKRYPNEASPRQKRQKRGCQFFSVELPALALNSFELFPKLSPAPLNLEAFKTFKPAAFLRAEALNLTP